MCPEVELETAVDLKKEISLTRTKDERLGAGMTES